MRIVQISDSHISLDKPGRAGELAACVEHINALDPQPDVVVHTGDVAHDGHVEEYAIARRLLDGLDAPYFVLAGNRDDRRRLIDAFADGKHLSPGMDFAQYAVEDFPVRLIAADTQSGTSPKGRLCQDRLANLSALIARDSSRPAALFLHHPPFDVPVAPDPFQFEDRAEADALMRLLCGHPHIRGLYCGHVHRGYRTEIGAMEASVLSSLASDLRWDKPVAAANGAPVLTIFTIAP